MDNKKTVEERLRDLENAVFKDSFSDTDIYRKRSLFKTELGVPHYASDPANGKLGDIIEIGGKLMICAHLTSGTFVVVGSQS